jgi:hypothetical protein
MEHYHLLRTARLHKREHLLFFLLKNNYQRKNYPCQTYKNSIHYMQNFYRIGYNIKKYFKKFGKLLFSNQGRKNNEKTADHS